MFNMVILQGRVTNELKLETTQSGVSVCKFSVASQRNIKEKDGTRGTDFVPCVAFGQTAKFIADYFAKGSQIIVNGRLNVNTYEKEGNRLTYTNIVVDSANFCDSKSSSSEQAPKPTPDIVKAPIPSADNLPFDF